MAPAEEGRQAVTKLCILLMALLETLMGIPSGNLLSLLIETIISVSWKLLEVGKPSQTIRNHTNPYNPTQYIMETIKKHVSESTRPINKKKTINKKRRGEGGLEQGLYTLQRIQY